MGLLIFEVRRFDADLAAVVAPYRDSYEAWYVDVIQAGLDDVDFRPGDPKVDTLLILGLANGLLGWYNPAGRLTIPDAADRVAESALRMLADPGSDRSPDFADR